jgi:hypothetical protein
MTDWAVDMTPGVTVMAGAEESTVFPLMVALMVVAVPAVTPVKVAV